MSASVFASFVGKICLIQLNPQVPYTLCCSTGHAPSPLGLIANVVRGPGGEMVPKGYEMASHIIGKLVDQDDKFLVMECADPTDPQKPPIRTVVHQAAVITCSAAGDLPKILVGGEAPVLVGPGPAVMQRGLSWNSPPKTLERRRPRDAPSIVFGARSMTLSSGARWFPSLMR
jgi:hypothetical protein